MPWHTWQLSRCSGLRVPPEIKKYLSSRGWSSFVRALAERGQTEPGCRIAVSLPSAAGRCSRSSGGCGRRSGCPRWRWAGGGESRWGRCSAGVPRVFRGCGSRWPSPACTPLREGGRCRAAVSENVSVRKGRARGSRRAGRRCSAELPAPKRPVRRGTGPEPSARREPAGWVAEVARETGAVAPGL